ncbi:PAS domain S-box protein, partial [Desulfobacterales bacterium HSG16]|nr:PAS domain S-box protein [Desulfobacterales bacterium HSG16]
LASKLVLMVGSVLLFSVSIWAYSNIRYHEEKIMEGVFAGTQKLTNTIRLGTHYAMMINSRDDINQIITNMGRQEDVENMRIYNKEGQIMFSNNADEVGMRTNIKAEACDICHKSDPPQSKLRLEERTRIVFNPEKGYRLLGIINPLYNEPGCSGSCHVHPENKKVLGALDLVVSLKKTDEGILHFKQGILAMTVFIFLLTSSIMLIFLFKVVNQPIKKLIRGTKLIAKGDYVTKIDIKREDEIGQLATSINRMGREIFKKQTELNNQKIEYQNLFGQVPCIITVQNKDYRLVRYNNEFLEKFDPKPGDYCFSAYKGRKEKCMECPVEKTFADGMSHYSEESGINKDGTMTHWIVRTSPVRNDKGKIVAAMEMCLDITKRKLLEDELQNSEKKYREFFNNIPNPVFVLDSDTFEVLDCNESVFTVYEYERDEILGKSFLNLFMDDEREDYASILKKSEFINRVTQMDKKGRRLFVNIRVSPSEHRERKVFLVTTSDITKRLETEQQLAQASKMATLGEMATGVAHELNQPLTVIKTASSFIMKKLEAKKENENDPLYTMSSKINKNVDRASKIINHMRQFARKSEMRHREVRVDVVLEKALDMFSQQLKVRGIEVILNLSYGLPPVMADPDRLEQVFVNLLINARDAIEEKYESTGEKNDRKITLKTKFDSERKIVIVDVCDTGAGIAKNIADKLFDPFFTTKEVGKGTGLGLSISYGIVKDFHGKIRVKSVEDKGACFIVELPVNDNGD